MTCTFVQTDMINILLFVAVLTWLQIMRRRFGLRRYAVAVMTCRRFDRVPCQHTYARNW